MSVNQFGTHTETLVYFRTPTKAAYCRIALCQRQLTTILHHDVVAELVAQAVKQLYRLPVKAHTLFSKIVRANNGGVARCIAATQVALVQNSDIRDAVVTRKVVG